MDVSHANTKTNDKLVRAKLIEDLLEHADSLSVIEEFEVARGKARADVIQIKDGSVHAYEIKSDKDTLYRLPRQIKYYNQVFSTITLVVGSNHVVESLYVIPNWWGVVVAEVDKNGDLKLNQIRTAKQNCNINYRSVTELFRKAELVYVLGSCNAKGSYWSMSKAKLIEEVQKELGADLFLHSLSNVLLHRSAQALLML